MWRSRADTSHSEASAVPFLVSPRHHRTFRWSFRLTTGLIVVTTFGLVAHLYSRVMPLVHKLEWMTGGNVTRSLREFSSAVTHLCDAEPSLCS